MPFVARQFGLGQHIPLLYESVARSLKWQKIFVVNLGKITKDHDNKLSTFTWGKYRKATREASGYLNWLPAIKEYVFSRPINDYIAQYLGAKQGQGVPTQPKASSETTSFMPPPSVVVKPSSQKPCKKKVPLTIITQS